MTAASDANSSSEPRRRGGIRRHGTGWQVRVSAGSDPSTGERIVLYETVPIEPGRTKTERARAEREAYKEAVKVQTRLQADADALKVGKTKATVSALLDKWLPQHELDATTRMNYESQIRRYINHISGMCRTTRHGWVLRTRPPPRYHRCCREVRTVLRWFDGGPPESGRGAQARGAAPRGLAGSVAHTQGVAERASELSVTVPADDAALLETAAWLHDIGYSPKVRTTGCHQLDGARFLKGEGVADRLCALVAHHSAATYEVTERGRLHDLGDWPLEEGPVRGALWMADMTTSPTGELVGFEARLAEILARYHEDSHTGRAMTKARPALAAAISRVEKRLSQRHHQ